MIRWVKRLGLAVGLMYVSGMLDWVRLQVEGYPNLQISFHIGTFMLILVSSVTLLTRYIRALNDSERLNAQLKGKVDRFEAEEQKNKAIAQERERIMRDLHDDVGSKLLQLTHNIEEQGDSALAREALKSLREAIYCMDSESHVDLEDQLCEWQKELAARLNSADITCSWKSEKNMENIKLNSRQRVNLSRILYEAVNNVIRHADAKHVNFSLRVEDNHISLLVKDDGKATQIEHWIKGRGMHNIMTRAKELGGACCLGMLQRG